MQEWSTTCTLWVRYSLTCMEQFHGSMQHENSVTNWLTYGKTCSFELFYQIGLSDFGNFGTIKLDPPLAIRALVQIAADQEKQAEGERDVAMTNTRDSDDSTFDWDEAVEVRSTMTLARFSSACPSLLIPTHHFNPYMPPTSICMHLHIPQSSAYICQELNLLIFPRNFSTHYTGHNFRHHNQACNVVRLL